MNAERVISKINIEMNAFNESGGREDKACAEGLRRARTYVQQEVLKRKILTHDQQIVLEWLQAYGDKDGGSNPIPTVWYLLDLLLKGKCGKEVKDAFLELNRKQQAQVLQGFSEWAQEQEEE